MDNAPEYQRQYYARNKERITEQRRARRAAMTEQELEEARADQRQRTKKHMAKRKAEIAELITLATQLLETNHGL